MKVEDLGEFIKDYDVDYKVVGAEHENGPGVLFHWNNPKNPDDGECCHVTIEALEKLDPKALYIHIVHGRDVVHMTRIVGYYSRTSNWNKSKIGELDDRHKGKYTFDDTLDKADGHSGDN